MFYSVERMEEGKDARLAVRVSMEEKTRLLEVVDDVKTRNRHMDLSKVIRELIGLDPMNFVTTQNIEYLRTGDKKLIKSVQVPFKNLLTDETKGQNRKKSVG